MSVARHHSHSEQHRGFVPEDQLADLTPTAGYVPIATGTGNAEWGPMTGGGGSCDCCFEPHTERFVAVGGTPETFVLSDPAMYGVRVFVNGVRADPLDIVASPTDVFVDTIVDDAVVIDYERECGAGEGLLRFPGELETHDYSTNLREMNIIGNITPTGPAYLVIRGVITAGLARLAVGTDAFAGSGYGVEGIYDESEGPPTFPTATDEYMFRLEHAVDYWIAGAMDPYDPVLDGSMTMDVHYPVLGGTALASPGADGFFGPDHVNILATINTSGPMALFVTLNDPLPAGWFMLVFSDDFAQFYSPEPTDDPMAAGTYPFILNQNDTEDGDWHIAVTDLGGYDGGLVVDGEYETHLP